MNSDGKSVEPNIEVIVASILRIIADSAPSTTPNKLSAAYAPSPLKTEARRDLDDAFDFPELFRSLHSLADQLRPQISASNLNGHRIIADSAPSTPNKLSAAYAPSPLKTEARSDLDDAFDFPELLRSLHSIANQLPPHIGASVNGPRIDRQQRPERRSHESREMPFDRRRSSWEQASYDRAPDWAVELSALPLRTAETDSREDSSHAGGDGPEPSSALPPSFPFSPPLADISRQVVACKDTLAVGPMGQSRADVQSGIPMDDVPSPRMPGDNFGGPIIPAEFRAPGAEPSAPQAGVSKHSQAYGPIPEGLIDTTAAVELLRPLLREWLDNNMRSAFERALHVEVENAKTRHQ